MHRLLLIVLFVSSLAAFARADAGASWLDGGLATAADAGCFVDGALLDGACLQGDAGVSALRLALDASAEAGLAVSLPSARACQLDPECGPQGACLAGRCMTVCGPLQIYVNGRCMSREGTPLSPLPQQSNVPTQPPWQPCGNGALEATLRMQPPPWLTQPSDDEEEDIDAGCSFASRRPGTGSLANFALLTLWLARRRQRTGA